MQFIEPLIPVVSVLVRVSIFVKKHHDYNNSYKETIIYLGLAYSFRSTVHYHQGGKFASVQADTVLKDSRVLQLYMKTVRRRLSSPLGGAWALGDLKAYPQSDILQQSRTS